MDTLPPPTHVAIIMDGNGRWAKQRGLPRSKGHEAGAESVQRALDYACEHGIRYLTLYAFSVENWKRPPDEVAALMRLLLSFLTEHEHDLHERHTRLRLMGRIQDLPPIIRSRIRKMEENTAHYTERTLCLCLSYSGRAELVAATAKIARAVQAGELKPDAISEQTLSNALYLPDVPDPDLLIRTSGEQRISNFLLWQCAYSEFYFTPVLWPDFREADFDAAIDAYHKRSRRFGGV